MAARSAARSAARRDAHASLAAARDYPDERPGQAPVDVDRERLLHLRIEHALRMHRDGLTPGVRMLHLGRALDLLCHLDALRVGVAPPKKR